MALNESSCYENSGNPVVLRHLLPTDLRILDVGCGAGDTGSLIKARFPGTRITGLTCSMDEQRAARDKLDHCLVVDLETEPLPELPEDEYDVLLFCHCLEHFALPEAALDRCLPALRRDGKIVIVLPNAVYWRQRLQFVLGKFEYDSGGGPMDNSHLRFYTYESAKAAFVAGNPRLQEVFHGAVGSVPLWILRRRVLSTSAREALDGLGVRLFPNLFGAEIVLVARLRC